MHRRNSEETMQRLMDAGAELFDKKGYHNVSIKEIGRLAGCNSALISYHFGSKQALYQAIIDSQLGVLRQLEADIEKEEKTPLQRLKQYLHAILESQLDPRQHMIILYQELLNPSGLLNEDSWHKLIQMGDYVQRLLIQAVEQKELQAPVQENDYAFVTFILTAITEMLFLVKDRPLSLNPEGQPAEELLDRLIGFVLRPLMP
ncbi:TetR/AcrR family transcriptional regulator [Acidaminococcus fermentans]|uniref:TetR/AcrR family transcriptional regulator n=1 Tax=Acidaminococcus fermentans TaxID=905 RepID=UPI00242B5372|nr:TetR/AcrR family transcriptional regulator [Acidaminococcus fermentans]